MSKGKENKTFVKIIYFDDVAASDYITIKNGGQIDWTEKENNGTNSGIEAKQAPLLAQVLAFCIL